MVIGPRQLRYYRTRGGRLPFEDWLYGLEDFRARTLINNRLERFSEGNPGTCRFVGSGVFELKIAFGPGYRIYFGQDGPALVILLCGGDKGSQRRDIHQAHEYWKDYQRRTHGSQR